MIGPTFVLLGAALVLAGALVYARETLAGRTSPNRVTWFVWALAPTVAAGAQFAEGSGFAAVPTLAAGLGPLLIFCASFAGGAGHWRLGGFDLTCGALAVAALVGYVLSGDELVAVALAVVADALGAVPTIVKAWREPTSESHGVFRNAAINGAIGLLALQRWTLADALFPAYLIAIGLLLWGLIRLPRPASASRRLETG